MGHVLHIHTQTHTQQNLGVTSRWVGCGSNRIAYHKRNATMPALPSTAFSPREIKGEGEKQREMGGERKGERERDLMQPPIPLHLSTLDRAHRSRKRRCCSRWRRMSSIFGGHLTWAESRGGRRCRAAALAPPPASQPSNPLVNNPLVVSCLQPQPYVYPRQLKYNVTMYGWSIYIANECTFSRLLSLVLQREDYIVKYYT